MQICGSGWEPRTNDHRAEVDDRRQQQNVTGDETLETNGTWARNENKKATKLGETQQKQPNSILDRE